MLMAASPKVCAAKVVGFEPSAKGTLWPYGLLAVLKGLLTEAVLTAPWAYPVETRSEGTPTALVVGFNQLAAALSHLSRPTTTEPLLKSKVIRRSPVVRTGRLIPPPAAYVRSD